MLVCRTKTPSYLALGYNVGRTTLHASKPQWAAAAVAAFRPAKNMSTTLCLDIVYLRAGDDNSGLLTPLSVGRKQRKGSRPWGRGLSLVSSPLYAIKSPSQIQSSVEVKFEGVTVEQIWIMKRKFCMLDNAYGDNTLEELKATVIMMARIQPTDDKSDAKLTYNAEFISEVNDSQIDMINGLVSKSDHEQCHHENLETIIHTFADDQIDSDIIFYDPYVKNISRLSEHDKNAHDQSLHDFESLIINELETCKERVKEFETKPEQPLGYKEAYEELKIEINVEKEQLLNEKKNEMLIIEMEKISNDSKDIQATMEQRIKILENDFKRAEAQYINLDLKMQHQKEKNSCDVSWRSQMAKFNGENVSLNIQIESLVQENERIKLEFEKLFNSIKMTRVQHQQEVNELIENVNQKKYAYGDVHAKNQDLLMIISELKAKLKLAEKGKNVNTKFDKSATL
ncbi:hypothetical protein Tco_0117025 [Tanacetum coccineum]